MSSHKRRYDLPGIEALTKEQERVLALPQTGYHLVVGGPGTGKTVVCLLRARRHAQDRVEYQFLAWNHLLHRASVALSHGNLRAKTLNSWFGKLFWDVFGKLIPKLEAHPGTGWSPIDWDEVDRLICDLPESCSGTVFSQHLVIDEGQDMPTEFYDALNQLDFKNVFVAADQNQQIGDENSNLPELKEQLGVEEIILTQNHRNSYPIARLAGKFYTDPATPPPDLPPQGSTIFVPRLYYVSESTLPRIARSVLRHWDQNPRRLIGIIAPCNKVRENYFREVKLCSERIQLDNGMPWIETFHNTHRPQVKFDRGGILVINANGCKGQEFDTVILADIDEHVIESGAQDRTMKLFYVMVSRARERVVMFMKRGGNCRDIEGILPGDERILLREDLTIEGTNPEANK